jgi:hypothetical protein
MQGLKLADAGLWSWGPQDGRRDDGPQLCPRRGRRRRGRLAEVGEEAVNTIHTAVEAASVANDAEKLGPVTEEVAKAVEDMSEYLYRGRRDDEDIANGRAPNFTKEAGTAEEHVLHESSASSH